MVDDRKKQSIYEKAWKVVEILKTPISQRTEPVDPFEVHEACDQLANEIEDVTRDDVLEFFHYVLPIDDRVEIATITFDDFKKSIDRHLLCEPSSFDFYFRFGTAGIFPEGYQVGNGKIHDFEKLPSNIREVIENNYEFEFHDDKEPWEEKLDDYVKRRSKECYIHFQIKSLGYNKAEEKAFRLARTSANIFKILLGAKRHYTLKYNTPFNYYWYNSGKKTFSIGRAFRAENIHPFRTPLIDKRISEINDIINKTSPTDLEQRITNAIEVYGLIDDNTSLHVSFLLCVIALEGLLLSGNDRDYLGWKLSEKITYLIGESEAWMIMFFNLPPQMTGTISHFKEKHLLEAKIGLSQLVKELYGKRSGFAHSGLTDSEESISEEDFQKVDSIRRWIIERLLELSRNGITHLKKGKGIDNDSLDVYIQKLKYS